MTYTNILEMMETPGTHLHDGWREMPAPEIAKTYWRLDDDATMYEVLQQVAVDETNHRDVNHTFASMARDDATHPEPDPDPDPDPNPHPHPNPNPNLLRLGAARSAREWRPPRPTATQAHMQPASTAPAPQLTRPWQV